MEYIKNRFYQKAIKCSAEYQRIRKEYGDKVIAQVNIDQVLSGQKGIPALVTDTSNLDANEGIRFRGYTLPELREKLPKLTPEGEPLPEGLFYLTRLGDPVVCAAACLRRDRRHSEDRPADDLFQYGHFGNGHRVGLPEGLPFRGP